ncbi:MAG: mucoidy inhibitor MuiA family protein [Anaerolineales bacterium]|nr:MAG: mucoidy inhibitor MuiA family protein [Anaerolineales bacterium]
MTDLNTTITEVTIYPNRARVTRRGTVELKQGEHRLQVGELPLSLLPESVRAAGKGTAQARILAMDVTKAFYQEPPTATVAELEKEIEKLEDQDKTLADQAAAHQAQLEFLKGLGTAAGENLSRGIAFGKSKVADGQEMLAFIAEGMAAASQGLRETTAQRRDMEKELTKLRNELEQQRSARPRERYAVTVDAEVLGQGDFELEVTYVVRNASWKPLYDLRLDSDPISDLQSQISNLNLTYLGQVTQRTGEDWEEVALSLSTAKPALATILPELRPWYVSVPAPPPPIAAPAAKRAPAMLARFAPTAAEEPAPEMMLTGIEMEEEAEPVVEMEAVTAEVEETGAALTFRVAKPATIPSDGSPHKTTVAALSLTPRLDYVAAPKLVSQAYRRATVTNDTDYVFLPGPANVFYGGEYVGTTTLATIVSGQEPGAVAPGQEFKVFLGVDERIKVSRELVASEVDKKFIGDRRRLHYAYRIKVQNLRDGQEKIIVSDQIPVARHEEIKVRLDMAEPKPTKQTELGTLEWELDLEPGEEQAIRFDFNVEHPRSLAVIGLPRE